MDHVHTRGHAHFINDKEVILVSLRQLNLLWLFIVMLFFSWGLELGGAFWPNLVSVLCMVISWGLVATFVILTIRTLVSLAANSNGRKIDLPILLLFIVVAFLCLSLILLFTDMGYGASIRRSIIGISFLPRGNWLFAGGAIGWTYVVLLVAMVLVTAGAWLREKSSSLSNRVDRGDRPPKRQRQPRTPRQPRTRRTRKGKTADTNAASAPSPEPEPAAEPVSERHTETEETHYVTPEHSNH